VATTTTIGESTDSTQLPTTQEEKQQQQ